jgi:hypothetical protein
MKALVSERLHAIRERCKTASPAPWEVHGQGGVRSIHPRVRSAKTGVLKFRLRTGGKKESIFWDMYSALRRMPNYRFIAHARADIPWLLDLVDELRGRLPTPAPEDDDASNI